MAFLRKIEAYGFRSFQSLSIELRPLNWLIGANGAGKSNLLALFKLLNETAWGRLQTHLGIAGGAECVLHYGSKQTPSMEVSLSIADTPSEVCSPPSALTYSVKLAASSEDKLIFEDERVMELSFGGAKSESRMSKFSVEQKELGRRYRPLGFVCDHLRQWRVYHFNDTSRNAPIRKKAELDDNRYLQPDGSNLPAFLYLLGHKHPGSYEQIRETVQRIAPYFDDFELEPDRLNEARILLRWRERSSDHSFSIADLSDGTLRFVCLATLLLQPNPPPLILLDEPELGLHPAAIGLLSAMLHMASHRTQLIVATQSVELLDAEQDAASVLVVDRDREGRSTAHRLDPEALRDWLADYSLGELWKKNVPGFGGRP